MRVREAMGGSGKRGARVRRRASECVLARAALDGARRASRGGAVAGLGRALWLGGTGGASCTGGGGALRWGRRACATGAGARWLSEVEQGGRRRGELHGGGTRARRPGGMRIEAVGGAS
jgi:hypothetical protein